MNSRRPLLALLLMLASAFPAFAQLSAVSFNTTAFYAGSGGTGVFGWRFTALSNLSVVDVGLFDFNNTQGNGDGFAAAHTLAFWDMADPTAPLSISTISPGLVGTLSNGFRWVPVASPTLLLEGHQYVIGATYQSDDASVSDHNPAPGLVVTIAPDIEFGGYSFTNEPGLTFPDHHDVGNYAMFGPNFTYTPFTPVPEPATLSFVLAGGLIFVAHRVIRSRRAKSPATAALADA